MAGVSANPVRDWPGTPNRPSWDSGMAERLVEHLEQSGFVVMKKPPTVGAAALGRGYEGH